jgi:hypothetical protein
MITLGKRFIALFLIFSLLMINCATLKRLEKQREKGKKHGALLLIQNKDGQQVRGELITVKPNSLLLLDTEGKDVSVDIADIKVIRIVKKSKALSLGAIGLAGGVGLILVIFASLEVITVGHAKELGFEDIAEASVGAGLSGFLLGAIVPNRRNDGFGNSRDSG